MLIASFLIFAGLSAAPGDPVTQRLGTHTTEAQRELVRHQLGLDKPLLQRYWEWLTGALHGDFGTSITYRTDVGSLVSARIGTTLMIVVYSAILIVIGGVTIGVIGGAFRRLGTPVAGVTGVLIGVPQFVAAQVLVALFAVQRGWFPVQGEGSGVFDRIYHLTLPALALALGWSAYVAQVTMASVRGERAREHVETARGRGIAPQRIFRRHVLRNAAIPIVTVSGLTVAALFAGAIVVESAFNLAGIGSLLVKAVSDKDYNIVLAVSLILVTVFVLVTSLIDALQVWLDPRIARGGRA